MATLADDGAELESELERLKGEIRDDLRRLQGIQSSLSAPQLSAFLGRYQRRRPGGRDRLSEWITDPFKLSSVAYLKVQKLLQEDTDRQLKKRRPPGEALGPSSPSSQAI